MESMKSRERQQIKTWRLRINNDTYLNYWDNDGFVPVHVWDAMQYTQKDLNEFVVSGKISSWQLVDTMKEKVEDNHE